MIRSKAEVVLMRYGWLASSSKPVSDAVLAACQLRHVKAGSSLFDMDDDPSGAIGLAAGRVHMHLSSAPDDPTLFAVVTPGYWFADVETPVGLPSLVSAIAKKPCTVLRIGSRTMQRLATTDPEIALAFVALVTTNFATTLALLAVLRRQHIPGRIAAMLCALAGADLADGAVIHCSQTDLAAMCNIGRTVTASCLGALEAEGVITSGYAVVQINDAGALRAYCHLS